LHASCPGRVSRASYAAGGVKSTGPGVVAGCDEAARGVLLGAALVVAGYGRAEVEPGATEARDDDPAEVGPAGAAEAGVEPEASVASPSAAAVVVGDGPLVVKESESGAAALVVEFESSTSTTTLSEVRAGVTAPPLEESLPAGSETLARAAWAGVVVVAGVGVLVVRRVWVGVVVAEGWAGVVVVRGWAGVVVGVGVVVAGASAGVVVGVGVVVAGASAGVVTVVGEADGC